MTTRFPAPLIYTCHDCLAEATGDQWADPGRCQYCGGYRWDLTPTLAPARHVYELPDVTGEGIA